MTTDQPTTPRAALEWFADYLTEHDFPAPAPSSVYAQLAREKAERMPDHEHTPPRGPSGVSRTDDVDPVRACALEAAARWLATENGGSKPNDVIGAALAFEAYLRGDQ